jgi:hypothetical protein
MTAVDRCLGHVGGTAGEDEHGSGQAAMAPARPEGEVRPGGRLPRWQGPQARGSRQVGFEPASAGLQWAEVLDMKVRCPAVLQMSRDPLTPAQTAGFGCCAHLVRTHGFMSCCSRTLSGVMVLRHQGPIGRPGG